MREYAGIYRGVVADINDPEQRKRYRVRVFSVHGDGIEVEALPWAEWCCFGGKGFGDLPHFDVGDPVFVMFEGGNQRFPVLIGGWLSYQGGTSDMPGELTGDYARQQQRWIRVDRAGNKIMMSPLPDEQGIEIQSGETRVVIRGVEGTVEIASDARVRVHSPKVEVVGATTCSFETEKLTAQVAETATVRCDGDVNLRGAVGINLGRYTPDPVAGVPSLPLTTDTVDVEADSLVRLGSLAAVEVAAGTTVTVDATGDVTVRSAANLTVVGTAQVTVQSDGPVAVQAQNVSVAASGSVAVQAQTGCQVTSNGPISVQAAGDVTVQTSSDADVQVAGRADVAVAGSAAVTVGGSVDVTSTGALRLRSATRIDLDAPDIHLDAAGVLAMRANGTASLDAAVIVIG